MKNVYIFGVVVLIISAFFLTKNAAAASMSFEDLGAISVFRNRLGVQKFRDGNTVCYVVAGANGTGSGISCVRVK